MERGYSTHSRYLVGGALEKEDQPVLTQLKKAYWTTKQQIRKTMGKKEDEHITASDAELDAKLELFKQIKLSCIDLLRVILNYQKRLVTLAREENSMGRFLKAQGEEDATNAGKMMSAVGKSQTFSAQHRVQMRHPLYRLFQEVDTFRCQAIVDTQITVTKMEEARTEYRGALLWMKDVSERLDPDAYNRLEKFRKVQNQVRRAKELFDKYKLDVLQKVDLLAASRSNMFSHALASYQNALLSFWKKMSRTMNAVSETFKGFQYYEFTMLKSELDEATKELARETASERTSELLASLLQDTGDNPTSEEDKLIYDIIMSLQDKHETTQKALKEKKSSPRKQETARRDSADSSSGLIDFGDGDLDNEDAKVDQQFGEFQAAMDKESKELDLIRGSQEESADKYGALREANVDLLDDIFGPEQLSPLSADPGEELHQPLRDAAATTGAAASTGGFMPSDLLDSLDLSALHIKETELTAAKVGSDSVMLPDLFSHGSAMLPPPPYSAAPQASQPTGAKGPARESTQQEKSSWYNLFADLDPLQDPDAIGQRAGDPDGSAAELLSGLS